MSQGSIPFNNLFLNKKYPNPRIIYISSVTRRANGGTRSEAQALGVHQHTLINILKRTFKQNFRPKYA